MRRPIFALALACVLGSAAFALIVVVGNPTNFRPTTPPATLRDLRPTQATPITPGQRLHPGPRAPRPARLSVSGPILSLRAVALDGAVTGLDLAQGLDLSDPLPVPPGAVDLEIALAGPIRVELVSDSGRFVRELDLPTLVVAIDEPGEELEAVVLALDPALADSLVWATEDEAAALVGDAALATAWEGAL